MGLELHPAVLVHGDVTGVASRAGAEEGVVGRAEADLDRERDPPPPALDEVKAAPHRLGAVRSRNRVLHLREVHEPRVRVDAVAPVDARRSAREPTDRTGDPWREARNRPAGAAEGAERAVLDHDVLDEALEPPRRPRLLVGLL